MMGSASYAVAQWFVAVCGALMELVRGALAAIGFQTYKECWPLLL